MFVRSLRQAGVASIRLADLSSPRALAGWQTGEYHAVALP